MGLKDVQGDPKSSKRIIFYPKRGCRILGSNYRGSKEGIGFGSGCFGRIRISLLEKYAFYPYYRFLFSPSFQSKTILSRNMAIFQTIGVAPRVADPYPGPNPGGLT